MTTTMLLFPDAVEDPTPVAFSHSLEVSAAEDPLVEVAAEAALEASVEAEVSAAVVHLEDGKTGDLKYTSSFRAAFFVGKAPLFSYFC